MSEAVENMRRRLEGFDPEAIRKAMQRAQVRLECESHVSEIMEAHALDRQTVLRIIHQAAQRDVEDLAEFRKVVDGIAQTVIGESDDWADDARVVLTGRGEVTSLKATVDAMQSALQTAMSSEMSRVVSSSTP